MAQLYSMVIIGVCSVSAVSDSQTVISGQLMVCERLKVCELIGKYYRFQSILLFFSGFGSFYKWSGWSRVNFIEQQTFISKEQGKSCFPLCSL